ncbi:MAG: lipoyl(octanoyl) transferase LipB [Desulfosarcinaceae bacterium]
MRGAYLLDLPLTGYESALEFQRRAVAARKDGRLDRDLIIALEHPPVFTLGRRGGRENLLVPEDRLSARGIAVVPIERGGDITYHGPGQLVIYVIMALRKGNLSVTGLVSGLEQVMVAAAARWGLDASGNETYRGAWIGRRKLGSIGITIRRGVSFHGLALNVNTDLEPFSWINPCGIQGCSMTSLAREIGGPVDMAAARREALSSLASIFELHLEPIDVDKLERLI